LTLQTVAAMQGVGGTGRRPIQGQPQWIGKDAQAAQHAVRFKALKDLKIYPIEGPRQPRIKQMASLVVTGNRLNATYRPGILLALAVLQMAWGVET
jgi:hypothetical protein